MTVKYKYTALAAFGTMLSGIVNAQSPARTDDANDAAADYADSLSYDDYLADRDLRATELVGARIRNADGEDLGEIEELVIPSEDEDDMLLIVSVGGVLDIGDKMVAIPYEELRVSRSGDAFFVDRTQQQLESAPAFSYETQAEEGQAGAARRDAQSAQAQQRPLPADRGTATNRDNDASSPIASPRSRSSSTAAAEDDTRLTSTDHRASAIIGSPVIDNRGEEIGQIDDLVVSIEDEEIQAVLSLGGVAGIGDKLIAVPLDELQISPSADERGTADEPRITVDMTAEQLLETKPEFRYERQDERSAGPV